MKRAAPFIALVLLGVGAWWLYRVLFPPDETVIRRLLTDAAEAASVQAREGPLDKLLAVDRLVHACTPDVEIVLNLPGLHVENIRGRDQLREAVAAMRGTATGGKVTLMDIGIDVKPGRSQATAQFLVRARWGGATDEIVQELKVDLSRVEGKWKVRRVEPLPSLGM